MEGRVRVAEESKPNKMCVVCLTIQRAARPICNSPTNSNAFMHKEARHEIEN